MSCVKCQLHSRLLATCWVQLQVGQYRCATGGAIRFRKREEKKERVTQYVGAKSTPTEKVYVWGNASTGALGVRSYLRPEYRSQHAIQSQSRPTRLKFMDINEFQVYDAACGYGFTLYAMKRRRKYFVMGTGINTDSQLGYHEYPNKSGRILDYIIEPAKVSIPLTSPPSVQSVKQLACGRAHSIILTNEGVFSQGNNAYGQCGRNIVSGEVFSKVSNIQKIHDLPDNVSKVVCGQDHTLFLTETGEVYSCGLSADGQTGVGTYKSVSKPTKLGGDIDGVHIADMASRADCVLAVSSSGEVFGWGNSEYHQLAAVTHETQVNIPRRLPMKNCGKIIKVAAMGSACAVLNDNGDVFVWGYGVLGKGPVFKESKTPSHIPPPLFGRNELQPDMKVVSISCGMSHFVAVTDHGDIYTWGKGPRGCLGLYKTENQFFPFKVAVPGFVHRVECGVDHSVALCRSFT